MGKSFKAEKISVNPVNSFIDANRKKIKHFKIGKIGEIEIVEIEANDGVTLDFNILKSSLQSKGFLVTEK